VLPVPDTSASGLVLAPAVRLAGPGDVAPLPPSAPVALSIPALGVRSDVVRLGLEPDGAMEVPDGAAEAGWYEQSPTPGDVGPSVLVAHVDWADQPGVFHDLSALEPGDEVSVTREDGRVATFAVERIATYPKAEFPTDDVYGDLDHPALRLVTCGGVFDESSGDYADNVVVYAVLTGSS
jgi:sortase (surface protein transpeptidase)